MRHNSSHRIDRARTRVVRCRRLGHVPRLGQEFCREEDIEEAKSSSEEARSVWTQLRGQSAERWAECDAGIRRCGQPTQPLCAILRAHRVGDVRLNYADRSSPGALNETREKEEP